MPTVLRVQGLRIVIYPNDHRPPHVHVIGPDGEARVAIDAAHPRPILMDNEGLPRRALVSALIAIDEHRDMLLDRWREIHD